MSFLKTNGIKLGNSVTPNNNFLFKSNNNGTLFLARGEDGSLGNILDVTNDGKLIYSPKITTVKNTTRIVVSCVAGVWRDTGLTVTVTPTKATSRILFNWKFAYSGDAHFTNVSIYTRLIRGTNTVVTVGSKIDASNSSNQEGQSMMDVLADIDSPNTILPIVYKVQVLSGQNQNVVFNGAFSSGSTLNTTSFGIFQEII